jgi:hypothetical protein
LNNQRKIVLTGTSAGGIAASLWVNYLSSIISNPYNIFTIIDSGLLLNEKSVISK